MLFSFHNFRQFNTKAATAYHPIIQKVLDKLLAMDDIEPLTGGAGFYSNVFVVLKYTDGMTHTQH